MIRRIIKNETYARLHIVSNIHISKTSVSAINPKNEFKKIDTTLKQRATRHEQATNVNEKR